MNFLLKKVVIKHASTKCILELSKKKIAFSTLIWCVCRFLWSRIAIVWAFSSNRTSCSNRGFVRRRSRGRWPKDPVVCPVCLMYSRATNKSRGRRFWHPFHLACFIFYSCSIFYFLFSSSSTFFLPCIEMIYIIIFLIMF